MVNFVTTALRQAYEYYQASINAGIHTKPLLLYYSVHNLTKAVLAVKKDTIDGLDHHGLSLPKGSISNDLFEIKLMLVTRGVFHALAKHYGTKWCDNEKTLFKAFSLFAGTIEFVDSLGNIFQLDPSLIPVRLIRRTNGEASWTIAVEDPEKVKTIREIILKNADLMSEFSEELQPSGFPKYLKSFSSSEDLQKNGPSIFKKFFEHSYLPHDEQIVYLETSQEKMPQECSYYAISFLLGMLVRYHPHVLHETLYGQDLKYRLLVERACHFIARLYPNYMLNLLIGKSMKFVTSV